MRAVGRVLRHPDRAVAPGDLVAGEAGGAGIDRQCGHAVADPAGDAAGEFGETPGRIARRPAAADADVARQPGPAPASARGRARPPHRIDPAVEPGQRRGSSVATPLRRQGRPVEDEAAGHGPHLGGQAQRSASCRGVAGAPRSAPQAIAAALALALARLPALRAPEDHPCRKIIAELLEPNAPYGPERRSRHPVRTVSARRHGKTSRCRARPHRARRACAAPADRCARGA